MFIISKKKLGGRGKRALGRPCRVVAGWIRLDCWWSTRCCPASSQPSSPGSSTVSTKSVSSTNTASIPLIIPSLQLLRACACVRVCACACVCVEWGGVVVTLWQQNRIPKNIWKPVTEFINKNHKYSKM